MTTQRTPGSEPTAGRAALTRAIVEAGAVAVLRMSDGARGARVIDAICAGGIRAVEVTVTVPGAIDLIADAARRLGDDLLLGVGSVLDAETARRAVDAGARYVVSPVLDPAVVAEAHRLDVPALPGAFTPTEALAAHRAGADIVKIFPAEVVGMGFLKGVLAPMPFLRLMPTGGVTPENVGDWLRAGAVAVGVGSALLDPALIAADRYAALTERARRMADGVRAARAGTTP